MVTAAALATESMQNILKNTSMDTVDLDVSFIISMMLEED